MRGICKGCREDISKELSKFTFCDEDNEESNIEDDVPQAKKICLSSEVVCRLSVTDGNCLQYENCTTCICKGCREDISKELSKFTFCDEDNEESNIEDGICKGCREDISKELSKFTFCDEDNEESNIEDDVPQAKKICLSSEVVCRLSVTDGNCLQYENCTTCICKGCREDISKELSKFTFCDEDNEESNIEDDVPQAKKICLSSEVVCRLSVTDGNCLQYENCTTFEHVKDKSVEGSQDSQEASTIQGTASSQVTDSQTSDWFYDELTARDKFNHAMNTISQEFTPLRSQPSHDWDILQRRTKNYYLSKAVEIINIVVSYIAPDQEDKILPDVCIKLTSANYIQKDTLIDELIVAYIASNHSDIQIQILSVFANKYAKEELIKLVPGLTISKIDRARKHAALCGPGDVVKKEEIHRDRLTRAKIAHFLEFSSSPAYCQIVGFGSKIIKLSNGAEIKTPKDVRTVMASRVIQLYDTFCESTDFSSLRRSSLYKIVKLCASSQKTSLQGLDNTIADGMKGIDTLEKIVRKLNTFGLDPTSTKEVTLFLFRTNVVNHCSTYALSDNKEKDFSGKCQHEHDNSCSVCSAVLQCESKVTDLYKEIQDNIPSEQKEEIEHDLEMSGKQISAWHSHCIRKVHQDTAKQDILSNLKPNEVLVIMDWVMKFIPFLHREKQAEFFGKEGMCSNKAKGST
ncbi:unnamed protein product [Mytilus coruscus]|uniref:Uncharacterized protein n=1 Tax=Mytilus coruscus TaxID=42192 RepID=A0A6J8DXG6_MYTCO|nr:unnamed protein product [Mytilus coruscus]